MGAFVPAVVAAEESGGLHVSAIVNGLVVFAVLLILLFVVTRFNPDR